MSKTIFTKIINKEIPAKIVFEDEHVLAFEDINPQAPVHILVIPKLEIARVANCNDNDATLLGKLLLTAARIAKEKNMDGYRLVINNGQDGGQTVEHIHVHLLGGRQLLWPPG